ncbi:phosphotriesterase family protein [Jiangella muralis]|uniref:phosphotriesterase family protein n=1 Tax=Jiangella muralis TaxID=702383 RepID=UPI00069DBD2D|nr:hypothetical protein [Jiangella muralis]
MSEPVQRVLRTVLGDIPVAAAGHIQPHEHVLCDMSGLVDPANPNARDWHTLPATVREAIDLPVRPDTYDAIKRSVLNRDNLRLCSEEDAISELMEYVGLGGGTMVDSSTIGLGRDPLGLARVSRRTGVHIVMGSGYYVHALHPRHVAGATVDDLTEEISADVTVGIDGVRAGLIGEIGLSSPLHPDEAKVLEAALQAQSHTGAAVQIHPGRATTAPLEAMSLVEQFGADPSRVIMSHLDRTIWHADDFLALARTGCYLEFDLFGQESSYYAFNPDARRPNDRTRVEWLTTLAAEGYADRLLVSQDICQKVYLRRYGGPGYGHILRSVLGLMRSCGWRDEDIEQVTHHNPATALGIQEVR